MALFYGFKYHSACNCGGVPTKNYDKTVNGKRYELKLRPLRGNWVIRCQNTIIAKGKESELITKLTEHGLV